MAKHPLVGLAIRDAAVRRPDLGFILAGDPKREEAGDEHTIAFRWKAGEFHRGEARFTAHACSIIDDPEYGVVKMSSTGIYSVETRSGVHAGNVFNDSSPAPSEPRYGDIRCLATIGAKAYAAGLGGIAYRMDRVGAWTRIDEGLPSDFDIEALDGFGPGEVYAAGYMGQVWQYDGRNWVKHELPTNEYLNAVACAGNGEVYMGGRNGLLVRGRHSSWTIVEHEETEDPIWDIEWFGDVAYVATMSGLYALRGEVLEPVEFGDDRPKTTYHLSASEGVLWSIGEKDIVAFDGTKWDRIV